MKYIFDKVKEFNEAFDIDIKAQSKELRYDLFKEEADEYLTALNDVDRADAIADMLYIWAGTVLKHGLENDKDFNLASAIAKLKPKWHKQAKNTTPYIIHNWLTYANKGYVNSYSDQWVYDIMRGIIDAVINEKLLLQILPIFDAVHESNMAKLGADGKPIINGQNGVLYPGKPLNKVMKPEGWKDPKEKIFKILSEN